MSSGNNLFSLKRNIDSFIVGLLGVLLIYLFTKHGGIGLEPDSIAYLSTARNVVHGNGFMDLDGFPLIDFPLGYPAFLGLVLFITRVDLLLTGQFINMLLYFCLIYLSGGIINHISTKNRWVKIPFLLLIVFSPAMLGIYTMMLSETLFLVITLLFFIALHHYGQHKTIKGLIIVAVIAGVSCLVRYAGVTLIGAAGLMILLDRKLLVRKKISHLALLGTLGSAFWIANLFRNYLITNMMMGDRQKSYTSLYKNIENYSNVFGDFFYLHSFPMAFIVLIGVSFFVFYIYSHIIHIYKTNRYYNYWNILAVYFIVYALFMVLSSTFSRFETLDMRLLSPLYLPCVLPFTFVITWLISKQSSWKKYGLVAFFSLLFVIISYGQYHDNCDLYDMAEHNGLPGYAEDRWKNSQLIEYITQHKERFNEDTRIYSNGNEAVYLFTGLKAEALPNRIIREDNEYFIADNQEEYYLVWVQDNAGPDSLSFKRLLNSDKYILLSNHPEGQIYFHPATDESQMKK
jgi:hypothetical protein